MQAQYDKLQNTQFNLLTLYILQSMLVVLFNFNKLNFVYFCRAATEWRKLHVGIFFLPRDILLRNV